MAIIETVARLSKKTKEPARAGFLIPEYLRISGENMMQFLRAYYDYMNTTIDETASVGTSEYLGKPSSEIASLNMYRDIDTTIDRYLDQIQKEVAASVPDVFTVERIKLFKKLIPWYVTKGSVDSIELFFRIVFSEDIELYYPKTDLLMPSSGNWNGYQYNGRNGFLSDIKKMRNAKYYQEYSYVIQIKKQTKLWKDTFNRLVHPAGFIFFGELLEMVEAYNANSDGSHSILGSFGMPETQPYVEDWKRGTTIVLTLDESVVDLSSGDVVTQESNGMVGIVESVDGTDVYISSFTQSYGNETFDTNEPLLNESGGDVGTVITIQYLKPFDDYIYEREGKSLEDYKFFIGNNIQEYLTYNFFENEPKTINRIAYLDINTSAHTSRQFTIDTELITIDTELITIDNEYY